MIFESCQILKTGRKSSNVTSKVFPPLPMVVGCATMTTNLTTTKTRLVPAFSNVIRDTRHQPQWLWGIVRIFCVMFSDMVLPLLFIFKCQCNSPFHWNSHCHSRCHGLMSPFSCHFCLINEQSNNIGQVRKVRRLVHITSRNWVHQWERWPRLFFEGISFPKLLYPTCHFFMWLYPWYQRYFATPD